MLLLDICHIFKYNKKKIFFGACSKSSDEEVPPVASTSTAGDVSAEVHQVRNCQN